MFDSSLNELARRSYAADHIEGNFGSASLSFDQTHVLVLFGGIYFVQLVSSQSADGKGSLHLAQIHNMISFEQNVYQALEFMPSRILVSLWEPGYLVLDRTTGRGLLRIADPIPTNINCRGFWPLPGFDPEKYPFVIARNQVAFSLINVKTGFA